MNIYELLDYLSVSNTTETEKQLLEHITLLRALLEEATPWFEEMVNDPIIGMMEFKSGTDLDAEILLNKMKMEASWKPK